MDYKWRYLSLISYSSNKESFFVYFSLVCLFASIVALQFVELCFNGVVILDSTREGLCGF